MNRELYDAWVRGNGCQQAAGVFAWHSQYFEGDPCEACESPIHGDGLEVVRTPALCTCFTDPCWEQVTSFLCQDCAEAFESILLR
jgi:hypothetical protein